MKFMTTMFDCTENCALCGTENRHRAIGSCSTMGCFTDGRPIHMGIDPLPFEVNRCKSCGYCAPYLNMNIGIEPEYLETEEYKNALATRNNHLCYAILLSKLNRHEDSQRMFQHAAWIQDSILASISRDYRCHPEQRDKLILKGKNCRALTDWIRWKSIYEMLELPPTPPERRIVMAELLRCVGEFEKARVQTLAFLNDPRDIEKRGIARQILKLIDAGETSTSVICNPVEGNNPKLLRMKLDQEPFDSISRGRKTVELRLNDTKRRGIEVGDIIEFTNRVTSSVIYADVTEVKKFSSFDELYTLIPTRKFDPDSNNSSPTDMNRHYSKLDQEKFGVIAIGVKIHPIDEEW